jgi:RNA polymerase sigma-70 factor (ECF subfamily)
MSAAGEGRFPTTHWTLIARLQSADGDVARRALDELCTEYHYPLYCYIRRRGLAHHDAQDALHDFLAKLLRLDALTGADVEKGRLRTYLATALHRFLINWHRDHASRHRECSLDEPRIEVDEERFAREHFSDDETPERTFERKWVHELLLRVLRQLGDSYAARGKTVIFETLRPVLIAGGSLRGEDAPRLAATLGLSEGTLRVKFSRLLREYRTTLEAEVFVTVASPEEIEEEIAHLLRILRRE